MDLKAFQKHKAKGKNPKSHNQGDIQWDHDQGNLASIDSKKNVVRKHERNLKGFMIYTAQIEH